MSKRTVPAAGAALPADGSVELIRIADQIDTARNFLELLWMAANDLPDVKPILFRACFPSQKTSSETPAMR
jgi:hypothetical protein